MRPILRACLLGATWGCGKAADAAVVFDAAGSAPPVGSSVAPSDAANEVVPSPAVDAFAMDDISAADAASMQDTAATGDSASCSVGPATAQVDGTTVSFAACVAYEFGNPGQYYYLKIDCQSPTLLVGVEQSASGPPHPSGMVVEYTAADSGVLYYDGAPTVTIASLGAVGGFVDVTVSAPTLQAQTPTGQTISFQGSFHVCRGHDVLWLGH